MSAPNFYVFPEHMNVPDLSSLLDRSLNSPIKTNIYIDLINIVSEYLYDATSFIGPKEWESLIGRVHPKKRNLPSLPSNIVDILQSDCPFFLPKTIGETHLLILIPRRIYAEVFHPAHLLSPFTIDHFTMTAKSKYKPRLSIPSFVLEKSQEHIHGNGPIWALITKNLIPNTIGRHYENGITLLEKVKRKSIFINHNLNWQFPVLRNAAFCCLAYYVKTGLNLFESQEGFGGLAYCGAPSLIVQIGKRKNSDENNKDEKKYTKFKVEYLSRIDGYKDTGVAAFALLLHNNLQTEEKFE